MAESRTPRAAYRSLQHSVCCEGPQQSTIGVWFEREGSGVCSAGQMRANTEVSICISIYMIMMVMSFQTTCLFILFFQHKFNSHTKREALKKHKQLIDCLLILFISCESPSLFSIGICVIFRYLSLLHHR
jgi:hypothetical protein